MLRGESCHRIAKSFAAVLLTLNVICLLPAPAFGVESGNLAIKAFDGNKVFYLNKKVIDDLPQNKLQSRSKDTQVIVDGVILINTADEDTLAMLVRCLGRPWDVESILIHAKQTPEQLAKLVYLASDLGFNATRDAVFKEHAGTFSPLQTATTVQISADGHTAQKVGGASGAGNTDYAAKWMSGMTYGRFGCAVNATMRVRFAIERIGEFFFGFAPIGGYPTEHFVWYSRDGWWQTGTSQGDLTTQRFLDDKTYPISQGGIVEIEFTNAVGSENRVKFYRNNLPVGVPNGNGKVYNWGRNVPMYPFVAMADIGSSARMEIVEYTKPANPELLVRRLWGGM